MKGRKADFRVTTVLPALGFRRGVSNTPIKRPGRGERLFDGRVPVGRMQYAPTSTGLVGCRQDMRERFFILPPFRKADFRPSTALTFWGKPIASRRQPLLFWGKPIASRQRQKLFKGSQLQAVDSKNFSREAHCKPSTAKTFWGKPIASHRQPLLFEESQLQAVDSKNFLRKANCKPSTAKTFQGKRIAGRRQQKLFEGGALHIVYGASFLVEILSGADNTPFFLRSNESRAVGRPLFLKGARPPAICGPLDLGRGHPFRIIRASYFIQLR